MELKGEILDILVFKDIILEIIDNSPKYLAI